jgi:membrane protein implicated in regulation of membrane protease activity
VSALFWLVAGVLLAAAEALTGSLYLLMLGGGAVITAGVVELAHPAAWLDAVVFAVASLGLSVLLRPILVHRMSGPPTLTNVAALPGKAALVLESVAAHSGRVKVDGDVWTARPLVEADVYAPGDTVTVMRIDGATAVVWKGP